MCYTKNMEKKKINYSFINLILIFFVMSFVGWIFEVSFHFVRYYNFTNRGFLYSPIIPIYGFGSVLILTALKHYKEKPIKHMFMIMLACGTLEYLTSYILEILFDRRWWSYFKYPFNLNGRVCLYGIFLFGFAGTFLTYYFAPSLNKKLNQISINKRKILSLLLITILIIDFIASVLKYIR